MRRRARAALPGLMVILVTAYGGLLRLDAYVQKYGTLERPAWARVLTQDVAPWPGTSAPTRIAGATPITLTSAAIPSTT